MALEGERPSYLREVPKDGIDVQDEPVYWVLPKGRCACWSVRQLAAADPTDLTHPQTKEAYEYASEKLNLCCLGAVEKDKLAEFFSDLGTIADGRWKKLGGACLPANERAPCWWL
eukprot:5962173-Karenia_brevis.AAC.1